MGRSITCLSIARSVKMQQFKNTTDTPLTSRRSNTEMFFLLGGVGEGAIRGWALINFLGFQGGRLIEVSAYPKVGG